MAQLTNYKPEYQRTIQILTSEAHATSADVSAGHVLAGAAIHAWVGFTLVVVDVTILAAPARVTQAFIAARQQAWDNLSDNSYSSLSCNSSKTQGRFTATRLVYHILAFNFI